MNNKIKSINFDDYIDYYENLLEKQLSFFSKDRGYFSSHKVNLVDRFCQNKPTRIIDFGCGIGLSLPYLIERFKNAQIYATDLSKKSLEHVRNNYPGVRVLTDEQLENQSFDLIFIASIFHHVAVAQRPVLIRRLAGLLTEKGMLCVFEHNPFNPITRHMVSTCPFDVDAELISLREMKSLIALTKLYLDHAGYCLFFPEVLKWLRPLEGSLSWLPLGGQYLVVARNRK